MRQLGTLLDAGTLIGLTDGQLLERFATGPPDAAEAAFAALVQRHGPMVLRVCRGVLSDPHDAEDAFQATFLILVRKARGLWVRDSLGPWLHRVASRAAGYARSDVARRRRHERRAAERATAGYDREHPVLADEWGQTLHEEIARLPGRYRRAVVLCDLEGCPQELAAQALGCPVGTLKSRLARGRTRLRERLIRRGLAPSAGVTALIFSEDAARAAVPAELAASTIRAATRGAAGTTIAAGVASASVAGLTRGVLHAMALTKLKLAAVALLTGGLIATGMGVWGQQAPAGPGGVPVSVPRPRLLTPRERFAAIRAEREAAQKVYNEEVKKAKTKAERRAVAEKLSPGRDVNVFTGRMLALAEEYPDDPAGRDASLWVINQTWRADVGDYADQFARAAASLVRHHADDPEAVRIGLSLDNHQSFRRDALLLGFYAAAKGREARGLARFALAQYLVRKARQVAYAREAEGRPKLRSFPLGDDGKPVLKEMEQPDEMYAYHLHLRQCDPEAIRAEAERLFEEVIAEYGDVPYVTVNLRELEALSKELAPTRDGKPLTEDDRRQIEAKLARKETLAEMAKARLDEMRKK